MTKQELRKKIKEVLCSMPRSLREKKSSSIASYLFLSDMWQNASAVFLFLSFDTEVITDMMAQKALAEDKILAVPCINKGAMTFYRIMALDDSISLNKYGIREPCTDLPVVNIEEMKHVLVITPGLAFDRNKNRLGRGGGYYDRFIAKATGVAKVTSNIKTESEVKGRIVFAGICFSEQMITAIPVNSHDMKVDVIVTDQGIIP